MYKRKIAAALLSAIIISSALSGCDNHTKDSSQLNSDTSLSQSSSAPPISAISNVPIQQEYDYPYWGLKFSLPESILQQLTAGNSYMDVAGQIGTDNKIGFLCQFINEIPEDQRNMIPSTQEEYLNWLSQTDKMLAVGIYSVDYLEQYDISELSGCSENTEIGRSSDGQYLYYLSHNPENQTAATEHSQIETVIYEREPAPSAGQDFDVLGKPRVIASSIGDFKTEDINGNEITKEIFSEYELTMVNVFATWCQPCLQEIPYLAELDKELESQSVNIIGIVMDVNSDGTVDQQKLQLAQQIAKKTGAEYEFVLPDSVLLEGRLQGVNAYPETFFVDREGNIVGEYYVGSRDKASWEEIIQKELDNLHTTGE